MAALALPVPLVCALRPVNSGLEESPVRVQLENQLQSAAGLEEGSQDARYWLLAGSILMERGDVQKAIAAFRSAIRLDSESAEAHVRLAQAYLALRSYRDAAQAAAKASKLNPSDARTWEVLAAAQVERGELKQAQLSLTKLTRVTPLDPDAWKSLARVRFSLLERLPKSAPQEARNALLARTAQALQEASRLDPDDPWILNALGVLQGMQGNDSEALALFRKALALLGGPIAGKQALAPEDWGEICGNVAVAAIQAPEPDYPLALWAWGEVAQSRPEDRAVWTEWVRVAFQVNAEQTGEDGIHRAGQHFERIQRFAQAWKQTLWKIAEPDELRQAAREASHPQWKRARRKPSPRHSLAAERQGVRRVIGFSPDERRTPGAARRKHRVSYTEMIHRLLLLGPIIVATDHVFRLSGPTRNPEPVLVSLEVLYPGELPSALSGATIRKMVGEMLAYLTQPRSGLEEPPAEPDDPAMRFFLIRERLGLTQSALGRALARFGYNDGQPVAPPAISYWESGTSPIPEAVSDLLPRLMQSSAGLEEEPEESPVSEPLYGPLVKAGVPEQVRVSPDGRFIYLIPADGAAVRKVSSDNFKHQKFPHNFRARRIALSPNGRTIVVQLANDPKHTSLVRLNAETAGLSHFRAHSPYWATGITVLAGGKVLFRDLHQQGKLVLLNSNFEDGALSPDISVTESFVNQQGRVFMVGHPKWPAGEQETFPKTAYRLNPDTLQVEAQGKDLEMLRNAPEDPAHLLARDAVDFHLVRLEVDTLQRTDEWPAVVVSEIVPGPNGVVYIREAGRVNSIAGALGGGRVQRVDLSTGKITATGPKGMDILWLLDGHVAAAVPASRELLVLDGNSLKTLYAGPKIGRLPMSLALGANAVLGVEKISGTEARLARFPYRLEPASPPTPAGLEEPPRYVLRYDPTRGQTLTMREGIAAQVPWVPRVPQGLIAPNDPTWVLSVPEQQLQDLAGFLFRQYREQIARGYALQAASPDVVRAVQRVHPVPGLEPYKGLLTRENFGPFLEKLNTGLFFQAGSALNFVAEGQIASYASLDRPWQEVPYLGGRSRTWVTTMRTRLKTGDPETFFGGWSFANLSAYDPEESGKGVEVECRRLLTDGPDMGIPEEAIELVRRLHESDLDEFQKRFGADPLRLEEIHHTRDFVWASYWFETAMRATGNRHGFQTEAVIRPRSWLDRTVWNPAKTANDLAVATDLMELSGQSRAVADTLEILLKEKGDDWARGYLWFYRFMTMKDREKPAGTTVPGHGRVMTGWILDFVAREPWADLAPGSGAQAAAGMRKFHDENFLTEAEQIAILEKAGLEEEPVRGRVLDIPVSGLELDGLTVKATGQMAAGLEAWLEPGESAIAVAVRDQPAVRQLFRHPGIQELQAGLEESGVRVRELEDAASSRELLSVEAGPGDLILLTPDAGLEEWVPAGNRTPVVILPALVAAGLGERQLAALAAAARAHDGVLHVNDVTQAGLEEPILILRTAA